MGGKKSQKKRKMFSLLRLCTASFNLIGCASALSIGNATVALSENFLELWLAMVWLQNQARAIRRSGRVLPVRSPSMPGHQRIKSGQVPSEGQKQVAVV